MVWCGVVWCGVVWCGVVWCGVVGWGGVVVVVVFFGVHVCGRCVCLWRSVCVCVFGGEVEEVRERGGRVFLGVRVRVLFLLLLLLLV